MEQDNIQEAILQDELIDKFIRNKMTPEEEEAFKTNLAKDSSLRERAFATAIMAKCMREKRQEEEKAFIDQLNDSVAIDQDERIERFIRDSMSPEEEVEFKDELNYDKGLNERALATSLMAKAMKKKRLEEEKIFVEQLNAAIKASSYKAPSNKAKIISFKEFMTIAASLLIYLGFGGYQNISQYDYQQRSRIVAENISMETSLLARGEGDEVMTYKLDSISKVIKNDRDMTNVIAELQTLYSKRLTDIDCAQNSATIGWYLVLAYIKDDQKDKAKDVLMTLKKEQPQLERKINVFENKIN